MTYLGDIVIKGPVSVTDPCYSKDVWCRIDDLKLEHGVYGCYVDICDGRVSDSMILKKDHDIPIICRELGDIGVDAGLAGYFVDKPDFTNEAWQSLCDEMFSHSETIVTEVKDCFIERERFTGFWTKSGYGDGVYCVTGIYDSKTELLVGLTINFM